MTQLDLDPHWEAFVKSQLESGLYGSPREIIQDGLRTLEARQSKLKTLRKHLAEDDLRVQRGEFVEQSMDIDEFFD